ncbi:hypothetical protein FRC14_006574 [Serendipita sp. 396]|nr:hypothetical protein FRC14_006574 [Serendipita sp. 396]KAG8776515.1 hypothetical protein FRC15_011914 [Serendipita sp. 397]KAG8795880.1 hypothetical protein FRC16_009932 [Serendipita sp. 398]
MSDRSFFPYSASKPAAVLFATLFAVSGAVHLYQAIRTRTWFMFVLVAGTLLQVLGYVTRKIAIDQDPLLWAFGTSQTSILVAPAFLAAQDYMIIGRMMSYVGIKGTIIPHRFITKTFVFIDVICLITQAAGIAMFVSNVSKFDPDSRKAVLRGRNILLGGLVLQIVAFCIFLIIAILFHLKTRRLMNEKRDEKDGEKARSLRPLFIAFYASGFFVTGRSVFRAIEFGVIDFQTRSRGYLYDNEWPFYVLDAAPILFATILFNFVHPASFLPRNKGLETTTPIKETSSRRWWSRGKAEKESPRDPSTV